MLVTAFGHGRHTCPAQPFSLAAMTTAMTRLLGRYRDDAAVERPPATRLRADRWRGANGRSVPGLLRPAVTALSRCCAARWPVRSSSAGCRAGRVRRRRRTRYRRSSSTCRWLSGSRYGNRLNTERASAGLSASRSSWPVISPCIRMVRSCSATILSNTRCAQRLVLDQLRVARRQTHVRLGQHLRHVRQHGAEERPAPVEVLQHLEPPVAARRSIPRTPCRCRTSRAA